MVLDFSRQLMFNKSYEGYRSLIYYPISSMTTAAYQSSLPRRKTIVESNVSSRKSFSSSSSKSEIADSNNGRTQDEIDSTLIEEFLQKREIKYYHSKDRQIYNNIEKTLDFLKMMKKIIFHLYELKNERVSMEDESHVRLLKEFRKNMAISIPRKATASTTKSTPTTTTTHSASPATKGESTISKITSILKNGSRSSSPVPAARSEPLPPSSTPSAASTTTSHPPNSHKKHLPPPHHYLAEDDSDFPSFDWTLLGFQGQDPSTDFRDMGLLSLMMLHYFSTNRNQVANFILHKLANELKQCYYPFAIIGINITRFLLEFIQEMRIQRMIIVNLAHCLEGNKALPDYDLRPSEDSTCLQFGLDIVYDFYCIVFEEFYLQWTIVRPDSIMSFNSIFEEVKQAIRKKFEPL